jgi:hypothetical protein
VNRVRPSAPRLPQAGEDVLWRAHDEAAMQPTESELEDAADEGGRVILATLSRIAYDARERDREAFRMATMRHEPTPPRPQSWEDD